MVFGIPFDFTGSELTDGGGGWGGGAPIPDGRSSKTGGGCCGGGDAMIESVEVFPSASGVTLIFFLSLHQQVHHFEH